MHRKGELAVWASAVVLLLPLRAQTPKTLSTASPRLYVFDCGRLKVEDPSRFNLKKEQVAVLDLSVGCYLVVHPKGTLVWDTGVIPDSLFKPGGGPATKEYATNAKPFLPQMAALGYTPSMITYLAMSHSHWDHVANASAFAGSTWLVRKEEHDALFADQLPPRTDASMFTALKNTKTVYIAKNDYDVFGDGSVLIKYTPGHTAGHQVLFVKLAHTGPVVLSGDLYHYPEELKLRTVPDADFDKKQTAASRLALDGFLKKTGAKLWIQHDLAAFQKLKKAPAFYE